MQSDLKTKVALDQKTGLNRLTKLTTSFYVILEMLCNYRISPCLAMKYFTVCLVESVIHTSCTSESSHLLLGHFRQDMSNGSAPVSDTHLLYK